MDEVAPTAPPPRRRASEQPPRPGPLPSASLHVGGELDVETCSGVLSDVEQLLELGYREVRLDLTSLRFCDVVGLRALLDAAECVRSRGGAMSVSSHTCRSLELQLDVFRCTDRLTGPYPEP